MLKITFLGAGSTIFARNVIGDCMRTPSLCHAEFALYDIDAQRLEESRIIIEALNRNINENRATIKTYLGVENRKEASVMAFDTVKDYIQGTLLQQKQNEAYTAKYNELYAKYM